MRLFAIFFALLLILPGPAYAEHTGVGTVKVISGPVDVVRGETALRLTLGASIYLGDIIRSAEFGQVGVTFQDGTMLSLGPNGEMTIDAFVFDPAADKLSFSASLSLGVLTYASGEIAKLRPEAITVTTPLATIGVRGTRFAVSVETP